MKVWIVDDDQAICDMLKLLLSSRGYEVVTYNDPLATPIFHGEVCPCPADAMLIDYFMPNMNGLDFLREMEARGCKGSKAIITAHHSPELGRELARMGVVCFKKPFRFPAITRWLEECVGRASPEANSHC